MFKMTPFLCPFIFAPLIPIVGGESPEVPPFGFREVEIFRTSWESIGLCAADLNGDGLMDLAYADNEDATIRLLFQVRPEEMKVKEAEGSPQKPAQGPSKKPLNDVDFDRRFRMERTFTEKKVTALAVADLNGDGKPDLAYYGDPKELEVMYQSGEWGSSREKFAISDGLLSPDALVARDLDGDGRSDLVLLGAGKTYLLRGRREGGGLEKPQVVYNSFEDASAILLGDLDGDRRYDFVLLRPRASHPFLIRFQGEGGFGPEIAVKSLPIHRAFLYPLGNEGPAGIAAIQGNTRRIRGLRWGKPKEIPQPVLGEPRFYGFRPEGDPAQRRLELGDVNGDGRADLVVSTPETAELDVFLQDSRGELSPPTPFPTLAELKGIAMGDFDGDGAPEIAVASAREKAIGLSRWIVQGGGTAGAPSGKTAGRLSIPQSHIIEGEPLLVAAGTFGGGAGMRCQLAIVHKGADGKFHLSVREFSADRKLNALCDLPFEAGAEPNGLALFDADGDGRLDGMVFIPYEDPRLYVQEGGGDGTGGKAVKFREASRGADFGIGQLSKLVPSAFSLAEMADPSVHRGPAMLVAQKSYARALYLGGDGKLAILEQFAGRGAQSEISAACALGLDDDPEKEVLLFDRAASAIEILDRSPQGVYRPVRSITMPGFEFSGFRVLDLDGDGKSDVAVLGKQALAVLYRKGDSGELLEVARYDGEDKPQSSEDEKGLPDLLATGDLNGDGVRDLIFVSDPGYRLGFLTAEPGKSGGILRLCLSFPIFEERSFQRGKGGRGPRQMLAEDIDGDGKTDLVLLIHNRILYYPQD